MYQPGEVCIVPHGLAKDIQLDNRIHQIGDDGKAAVDSQVP